jgi:hypothetical protein
MKKTIFCIIACLMVMAGCAGVRAPATVIAADPAPAAKENSFVTEKEAVTEPAEPRLIAAPPAGMDLDAAIKEAAAQMEENLPQGTKAALISLASSSAQLSEYVLNRLEAAVVRGKKLVVVDRANLDKVRAEQGFQLSGEVDDNSAKAIGKLVGAGAIVTGSFVNLGDVYGLSLKAINMETAEVAVSYPADIAKSTRIETLLASGGGAGTGTQTAQRGNTGGTTTAPAARAPAQPAAAAPPASAEKSYKAGDKGPAGGIIFYSTDVAYTAPAPVDREYHAGQNGPAGGVVFYPVTYTQPDLKVDREYQAGQNGPAGGVVFYPVAYTQTTPKVDREDQIGDTGPAGGIIFYVNPQAGEWKYLEAAPASTEFKRNWGLYGKNITTDVVVGAGKQNTKVIATALENGGEIGAAMLCVDLEIGGCKDWFLPSKAELNLMYRNLVLKNLGSFKSEWYWSSSQADNDRAWFQNFANGEQSSGGYSYYKSATFTVRAIRQF